jgi:hypothetical protein
MFKIAHAEAVDKDAHVGTQLEVPYAGYPLSAGRLRWPRKPSGAAFMPAAYPHQTLKVTGLQHAGCCPMRNSTARNTSALRSLDWV